MRCLTNVVNRQPRVGEHLGRAALTDELAELLLQPTLTILTDGRTKIALDGSANRAQPTEDSTQVNGSLELEWRSGRPAKHRYRGSVPHRLKRRRRPTLHRRPRSGASAKCLRSQSRQSRTSRTRRRPRPGSRGNCRISQLIFQRCERPSAPAFIACDTSCKYTRTSRNVLKRTTVFSGPADAASCAIRARAVWRVRQMN